MSGRERGWYPPVKSLLGVGIAALAVLNYYAVCAGFAYSRAPLDLPASQTVYWGESYRHYSQTESPPIESVADYFYADYIRLSKTLPRDQSGNSVAPYDLKGLAKALQTEFRRAFDGDPYFFPFTPRAKTVANSWLMASTGIAGIAFLPTGEANVSGIPSTVSLVGIARHTAHELAHTRGVMRENDANLVSYYILLTSKDDFLRYAGYCAVFGELRSAVILGNNLTEQAISGAFERYPTPEPVLREMSNIGKALDKYQSFLQRVSDFFNDLYLKLSGVADGTGSYSNFPSGQGDDGATDPDTGETVYPPVYNNIQKLFFAIYEGRGKS